MAIVRFDEVYAFKSEKSKYVCVLLDFKKQIPVDVLPNRKKEYIKLDRDKSTFKSHRDFSSEKEISFKHF